jgi:hypothetical protein
VEIIYCRGGDKEAPKLAQMAGMRYGVRYDYTAYSKDIYMLDGGLAPKWARFIQKARKYRPTFALAPDYYKPDPVHLNLYIQDLSQLVSRVGVCPKFEGATAHIPADCIISESIPSKYAGYLISDQDLLPGRDYHLLGGDPRLQKAEVKRIRNKGGRVVSIDGNKLMLKAAHGQVFCEGKWLKQKGETGELAQISAFEIVRYLGGTE